jgi:hypothetical protein
VVRLRSATSPLPPGSIAVGAAASAANGGAAFGDGAVATGTNATAIGPGASATFANSSALGAGATATAVNQMAFGTASSTYRMPGIASAASLAAQSGPTSFVTTDANGTITNLTASVSALQAQVNNNDRRLRDGVAVAMATGGVPAVPQGRRLGMFGNIATYDGHAAGGVGLTGVLYEDPRLSDPSQRIGRRGLRHLRRRRARWPCRVLVIRALCSGQRPARCNKYATERENMSREVVTISRYHYPAPS